MGKRVLCVMLMLVMLTGFAPERAGAVSTSAGAAILVDGDSGRVLYEQSADARMLIASTTKIMTALVALREGNLRDQVTVSANAAGTEGSSMYLHAGEKLRLETLLYGLLLCSGNDAAVAIAEHIGGSVPAFAGKMNALAGELGMSNSSFANPSGLDQENHYSTARDMATLARAAMKNETFVRIVSTQRVSTGGRLMTNHNKLLRRVKGCIGLKTGYTRAAGRTLVSCVERNGQRLIAVTLRDGNDWADHAALYDYGFAAYPARCWAAGDTLGSIVVIGGEEVPLLASRPFSWPVGAAESLTVRMELPIPLRAPVAAGTSVGQAVFSLNGREVGRIDLLCGKTVLPELESAVGLLRLCLPE